MKKYELCAVKKEQVIEPGLATEVSKIYSSKRNNFLTEARLRLVNSVLDY